jgi:hypothetical protein
MILRRSCGNSRGIGGTYTRASYATWFTVCGRNLITGLTSATSPRVEITGTCKVGQRLWLSLPLLTCFPSAWTFRLLYRRGRKSRRDLWITLYIKCHDKMGGAPLKISQLIKLTSINKYWDLKHEILKCKANMDFDVNNTQFAYTIVFQIWIFKPAGGPWVGPQHVALLTQAIRIVTFDGSMFCSAEMSQRNGAKSVAIHVAWGYYVWFELFMSVKIHIVIACLWHNVLCYVGTSCVKIGIHSVMGQNITTLECIIIVSIALAEMGLLYALICVLCVLICVLLCLFVFYMC